MRVYGVLILFVALSVVDGLRCFTCTAASSESCIDTKSCSGIFDQCYSLKVAGSDVVTKGCQNHAACIWPMACCEGDFCNGALPTGPSVILLLMSSAILTVFF